MREVAKFYLLLHPRPAYVIGSGKWGERINFMAASWVSPVGEEPPSLMVSIDKESLTSELIKNYREFTVNVVTASLLDKLYYVGSRSGREVDKSSVFSAAKGEKVSAPVIGEAIGIIECMLVKEVNMGDVNLFIGEVLSAKADTKLFNERSGWNLREASIPLHGWGKTFFTVGSQLRPGK